MADILIDNQTAPATPAASKSVLWVDSTTKRAMQTDDGGTHRGVIGKGNTTTTQALGSAADTYITNSFITVPGSGMQVGQMYRWTISYVQTATTQTLTPTIRIGTNKSTGDTSIKGLAATVTTGASALGGMLIIFYVVHSIGASGTGFCGYTFNFGNGTIQSGDGQTTTTFDNTARAGQFVGISINPSSTVGTINGVHGELIS